MRFVLPPLTGRKARRAEDIRRQMIAEAEEKLASEHVTVGLPRRPHIVRGQRAKLYELVQFVIDDETNAPWWIHNSGRCLVTEAVNRAHFPRRASWTFGRDYDRDKYTEAGKSLRLKDQ